MRVNAYNFTSNFIITAHTKYIMDTVYYETLNLAQISNGTQLNLVLTVYTKTRQAIRQFTLKNCHVYF